MNFIMTDMLLDGVKYREQLQMVVVPPPLNSEYEIPSKESLQYKSRFYDNQHQETLMELDHEMDFDDL